LLERCISRDERLVTDAEVVQEILHRYVAIGRRDAIQPAFDALLSAVDEVFPVTLADTKLAKEIVLGWPSMSARDALHLAIMDRHGVGGILSFDRGFDAYPGVARIHD
jgi:predicted nucleic acid-binding protein